MLLYVCDLVHVEFMYCLVCMEYITKIIKILSNHFSRFTNWHFYFNYCSIYRFILQQQINGIKSLECIGKTIFSCMSENLCNWI